MRDNMKKLAPIIITIFTVLYLGGYAYTLLFLVEDAGVWRYIMGIIGLVVLGVLCAMIYTLFIRLKEIDKEDDDDLSKY
jgi:uncharacterized membrane protein